MAFGKRKQEQWDGIDRRSAPIVLVVNDDPPACGLLVRLIGTKGYRVIAVNTVGLRSDGKKE